MSCWGKSGAWSRPAETALLSFPAVAGARRLQVERDKACVLAGDGSIQCVGALPALGAVVVPGLAGVTKLVANDDRACALTDSKDLYCWGRFERFTGPNTVQELIRTLPAKIAGGVVDVAAGGVSARLADVCVVTERGTVRCIGRFREPVEVPGITAAVQIAMGQGHLCARERDGGVWCWGSNGDLQLGVADRERPTMKGDVPNAAVRVEGLPPATHIAAGQSSSCALSQAGEVYCWGAGGLLGDSTPVGTSRHEPKPIAGLRARDVGLDYTRGCAIDLDGGIHCWSSPSGLPPEAVGEQSVVGAPVRLAVKGASRLFVGPSTCATLAGGDLHCWGQPRVARFFTGKHSLAPASWRLSRVRSVASAAQYACVALADGSVRCAGSDEYGTLGRQSHDRWTKLVEMAPGSSARTP